MISGSEHVALEILATGKIFIAVGNNEITIIRIQLTLDHKDQDITAF